mmetsp:Transcript_814/g.2022  ORF Transcript_814/g.2022 Transcript_814/m.2022 type:complete len:259 (+) Transcript_814:643-1419(+)
MADGPIVCAEDHGAVYWGVLQVLQQHRVYQLLRGSTISCRVPLLQVRCQSKDEFTKVSARRGQYRLSHPVVQAHEGRSGHVGQGDPLALFLGEDTGAIGGRGIREGEAEAAIAAVVLPQNQLRHVAEVPAVCRSLRIRGHSRGVGRSWHLETVTGACRIDWALVEIGRWRPRRRCLLRGLPCNEVSRLLRLLRLLTRTLCSSAAPKGSEAGKERDGLSEVQAEANAEQSDRDADFQLAPLLHSKRLAQGHVNLIDAVS